MQEQEKAIRLPRARAKSPPPIPTPLPLPRSVLLGFSLTASLLLGFLGQWLLVHERDLEPGLAVWGAAVAVFAIALSISRDSSGIHARDDGNAIPFQREVVLLAGVL